MSVRRKVQLPTPETTFDPSKTLFDCGQDDSNVTVNIGPHGKLECMLCQTYLEVVDHTILHMVTHGIGTVICRCQACGKQGELAEFLQSSSTEEAGKTVWCNGCHSRTSNKGNDSTNDKKSSPGHKANVCEVCSKSFRSRGHLMRHHLVHSGAKPYLCEVCGTGFSQRSSLKLHVLSHTGLNPHKCSQCGQAFRFRVSLRSHILSVHGPPSSSTSSPTKAANYRCDRCGKQFATLYKLHRHYRSHTGERPYECTRCGKLFSQTGNLNLHRRKHEEEDAGVGCLPTPAHFDSSSVTKSQLSNMMGKQATESYSGPLLAEQHETDQYIPETGEALAASQHSKFLETILQHDSVGDTGNALSSIDTALLNPTNKVTNHVSQFETLNSEFRTETTQHKNSTELFTHFSPEGLLFIDQSSELEETTSNSEGVTLPTFLSLQPGTSVSIPQ